MAACHKKVEPLINITLSDSGRDRKKFSVAAEWKYPCLDRMQRDHTQPNDAVVNQVLQHSHRHNTRHLRVSLEGSIRLCNCAETVQKLSQCNATTEQNPNFMCTYFHTLPTCIELAGCGLCIMCAASSVVRGAMFHCRFPSTCVCQSAAAASKPVSSMYCIVPIRERLSVCF